MEAISLNIIYHDPKGSTPAQGLYSNVASTGQSGVHFVAGQLAVGAGGEVVGVGDFAAQFDRVFNNLEAVLKGMGGDLRSVLKFTTYVTARPHIDGFMKKRAALFPKIYPDRKFPPNTLLIVQGLVKPEFMLEVEAVVAI
jgi:enamine deaminase RidA (YjgF/YER057c/UK114 family)